MKNIYVNEIKEQLPEIFAKEEGVDLTVQEICERFKVDCKIVVEVKEAAPVEAAPAAEEAPVVEESAPVAEEEAAPVEEEVRVLFLFSICWRICI